jgi:hypothetical protein
LLGHAVQDGVGIERRRDRAGRLIQHGLLNQAPFRLLKQARALGGAGQLRGQLRERLQLAGAERATLLAAQADGTHHALAQHQRQDHVALHALRQ